MEPSILKKWLSLPKTFRWVRVNLVLLVGSEENEDLDPGSYPEGTMVTGLEIDHTKEESTQASFDSDDDDKKVSMLSQEQFLSLTQGTAASGR